MIENGIFYLDFKVFVTNSVGYWLQTEYNLK